MCSRRFGGVLPLVQRDAGILDHVSADYEAPDALVSGVMEAIREESGKRRTFVPGRVIRVAAAALLVAAVGFVLLQSLYLRPTVLVEFRLDAPFAQSVHLVGDFNQWDPEEIRLRDSDGDGTWTATVRLRKGAIHSYNFVIDDERWIADPESMFNVDDGFGGVNSMIKL
jgi:hypothetical protein